MNSPIEDIPFKDYLALSAWGSSDLKAMRRGPPARVIWERSNRREETDATQLGTAVHSRLLTPDLFFDEYVAKPAGMRFSTKEGKAWREANSDRIILSYSTHQQVESIVRALLAKDAVAASLLDSVREGTIQWKCSSTGESCKARPDWVRKHYLHDLKVSRYASSSMAFRAHVEGWMHQLAYYRTGLIECGMDVRYGRLVVVDPSPPHFVWTYEVKAEALNMIELENLETLRALRECSRSGDWPGTPNDWIKIEPPATSLAGLENITWDEPEPEPKEED